MSNLRSQLTQLLRPILPETPDNALNGTELIGRLHPLLSEYSVNSIRQHLSLMAADSTSVIAKVDSGHGYYLRKVVANPEGNSTKLVNNIEKSVSEDTKSSSEFPEEKFRALFIRYATLENRFAMRMNHTLATRAEAGVNRWKFPDVVLLDWDVGQIEGDGYELDRNLLEVKRSLGEQPFRLTSVELKVALTLADFRENFFQCVSNSKWAHHSLLAVATPLDDTTLVEELRRLGTSYDVSIVSYSISADTLQTIGSAEKIAEMSDAEFDELAKKVRVVTIATGRQRSGLDWEHIKDMRSRTSDFVKLFEWIAHCLKEAKPFTYRDFSEIKRIEEKY